MNLIERNDFMKEKKKTNELTDFYNSIWNCKSIF